MDGSLLWDSEDVAIGTLEVVQSAEAGPALVAKASSAFAPPGSNVAARDPASVWTLQRAVGNRATAALLRAQSVSGRSLARCAGPCACGGKRGDRQGLVEQAKQELRRATLARVPSEDAYNQSHSHGFAPPPLSHVAQQGAAPAAAAHTSTGAPGEGATEAGDLRASRVSEPGWLHRKPKGGKDSPKTEVCPPMERGEREEAAKAQLRLVERIPQREWLIYGFPIGGSEISGAEAGGFISHIVSRLMQGHLVYMTGQDPLEVLGFSDCFAGPKANNNVLRQSRAAKFCAGVKDHYASTPKTYPALIRSCEPAAADQYVGSNATRAERAQNRSILIRRVATKVQFQEEDHDLPYNPKWGPSEAHCAAYSSGLARDILGPVYTNNAHCSCLVTPDDPHNNCVRNCLQDKMWTLLANAVRGRKPNDPPMDINIACPLIWKHHRDCYHDCGCASEFIDYLAFDAVCNIALPCAVDSAAINLINRCLPATENDKSLPVD